MSGRSAGCRGRAGAGAGAPGSLRGLGLGWGWCGTGRAPGWVAGEAVSGLPPGAVGGRGPASGSGLDQGGIRGGFAPGTGCPCGSVPGRSSGTTPRVGSRRDSPGWPSGTGTVLGSPRSTAGGRNRARASLGHGGGRGGARTPTGYRGPAGQGAELRPLPVGNRPVLGLTLRPVVGGTVPELPPTAPVRPRQGPRTRSGHPHGRRRGSAGAVPPGPMGVAGPVPGTSLGPRRAGPLGRPLRAGPGAGTPTRHRGRQDGRRGPAPRGWRPARGLHRRSAQAVSTGAGPRRADCGTAPLPGTGAPWGGGATGTGPGGQSAIPDQARQSAAPTRSRHPAPHTARRAPHTRHPAPHGPHRAPHTWHLAPGTRHPAPGTPHPRTHAPTHPRTHAPTPKQATNTGTEVTTRHKTPPAPKQATRTHTGQPPPPQPTPDVPPTDEFQPPHGANQPPSSRR